MAIIDYAPEFGTKFTLIGFDGTRAVFNDPNDSNYVGVLTNITGLDSPEVRESGENLVAFDGGVQGPNYYGRRPVVIEGLVYGHSTQSQRASRLSLLMRASNAMRNDAILTWTPSVVNAVPVYITVRRQQPLRIDGGWNKTFQLSLVAADPRIYSLDVQTLIGYDASTLHPENKGNTETFPIYTFLGPQSNDIGAYNESAGAGIFTSQELLFAEGMVIDTLKRSVYLADRGAEARRNFYYDPSFESASSSYVTGGTNMTITNRHASQPSPSSGKGTKVLQVATVATGTTGFVQLAHADGASSLPDGYDAPNAKVVTVGYDFKTSAITADHVSFVRFQFYDASEALILTTDVDGEPSSLSWQRVVAQATAPPTSYRVKIFLGVHRISGGNLAVASYYFDGVTVEAVYPSDDNFDAADGSWFYPDSTIVFFDSTLPSESYQAAVDVDPTSLTSAFSVVDFTNTRWNGLVPGVNAVYPYHATGSGVLAGGVFRIDWRHAWL